MQNFSDPLFYIVALMAYLLGSVPFGLVVAKACGVGDLRGKGSGNIGATNVARVVGKKQGILTMLLDCGKGALAVMAAARLGDSYEIVAGVAVFLGHIFSFFLKFKGGRGVATALGVLFGVAPWVGTVCLVSWIVIYASFRISSVASLGAAAVACLFSWIICDERYFWLTAFLAVTIMVRHKENIKRLLRGEEKRV